MIGHPWRIVALAAAVTLLGSTPPATAGVFPGPSWATRSPAQAGLDAAKLSELADYAGGDGVVIRDGYLVYSWGNPAQSADWASASKPLLSTLLFLADSRGLCGIHQEVGDFLVGGSADDRSITFFDLANMISGYSRGEGPGEAWAYNDHAINLYGYVLFEEVFEGSPEDIVLAELGLLGFQDPIEISDWQYGRIKAMSVRDFARLGLLWLNEGLWAGTQVIPASYFALVENQVPPGLPLTSSDGAESWDLGTFGGSDNQSFGGQGHYGMNFWVNTNGLWPGAPANVYHAAGHGGQKVCWVVPDMNVVVAGYGGGNLGTSTALQLLLQAEVASPVEAATWSRIKAMHR